VTDRRLTAELLAALEGWGVHANGADPEDFVLVSSGALDSLGLFELSVWIEEKVGRAINPAAFDLRNEWDTPARIVRFIEKARQA
jgi:acyl carrier protein